MFGSHRVSLVILVALAVSLALPATGSADGVIVVEPPACDVSACPGPIIIADQLIIRTHKVDVTIEGQVAGHEAYLERQYEQLGRAHPKYHDDIEDRIASAREQIDKKRGWIAEKEERIRQVEARRHR